MMIVMVVVVVVATVAGERTGQIEGGLLPESVNHQNKKNNSTKKRPSLLLFPTSPTSPVGPNIFVHICRAWRQCFMCKRLSVA